MATYEAHFEMTPSSVRSEHLLGFYLAYERDLLRLCRHDDDKGVSISAAEIEKRATHDLELARACGITRHTPCTVLDAMAGWGIDGLTLQRLGCRVTCLEQSSVAWALLHNLFERLGVDHGQLHHTDAWCWLEQATESFQVVYLDPMFPERRKKALPGKRIQYLAQVVGDLEHDLSDWINRARSTATSRVVLKRRLHDPEIGNPDWTINGRSVRYDVYRPKKFTP
ncbi:MAG: class I SAM-dependent methyltransferase [Gammaproteobacteria bacterium]|nr:class I SAM-dependent methyltransferase [Gammaproteobacteria bacterium]